ncbi:hypothetical protein L603_004100000350 [Cellulosimicrobium cellulans J34]|nr:hypothetical protein L603_004100000350 [Cellulosimicrobium cellulans J34]
MLTGSTSSVTSRSAAMIRAEYAAYAANRGTTTTVDGGHSRRACSMGIAERAPYCRASYDAVATTLRGPTPPTSTGRPRSDGRWCCSTAAKNASASRWTIVGRARSTGAWGARSMLTAPLCPPGPTRRTFVRTLA